MEHLQRTWKHHPLEYHPFLYSPGHWCDWSYSLFYSSCQWTRWLHMWHMHEEKKGWYAGKDIRVLYVLTTFLFQALIMVHEQRDQHSPWMSSSRELRQYRCTCTLSLHHTVVRGSPVKQNSRAVWSVDMLSCVVVSPFKKPFWWRLMTSGFWERDEK